MLLTTDLPVSFPVKSVIDEVNVRHSNMFFRTTTISYRRSLMVHILAVLWTYGYAYDTSGVMNFCYFFNSGTNKATSKFKILLQLVKVALHNAPQPGPFTYAVQCMYIVPLLGKTYSEGFSHMLTSSLKHLKSVESVQKDFLEAKYLAAQLVLDILDSVVSHENRILVKLLETFEIGLRDMAHALYGSELDDDLVKARKHLRQYVKCFMESESNATAVALITRFSIQCCDESFLIKLIESNQLDIAEECATFMGKEMISLVIQKFLDMKMLKSANKLVKEHDLTEEFPDVSYLYKER